MSPHLAPSALLQTTIRLWRSCRNAFLVLTCCISPALRRKRATYGRNRPPCFPHTAKVLMYAYVLASCQDPDDNQRLSLAAASEWLELIGRLVFLGSLPQNAFRKITESEESVRRERRAISQREPLLTSSELKIEVAKVTRYRSRASSPLRPPHRERLYAEREKASIGASPSGGKGTAGGIDYRECLRREQEKTDCSQSHGESDR